MSIVWWSEIRSYNSAVQKNLFWFIVLLFFYGCSNDTSIVKKNIEDKKFDKRIFSSRILNYKAGRSLYLPFASSNMVNIFSKPSNDDLKPGAQYLEVVIDDGELLCTLDCIEAFTSLEVLRINNTKVSDLSPLQNLKLKVLVIKNSDVCDLSPLNTISTLEVLDVTQSKVSSLQAIQTLSLKTLVISNTQVSDLSPITNMPLVYLDLRNTPVMDISTVKNLPLQTICYSEERVKKGLFVLEKITTLQCVNGKSYKDVQSKNGLSCTNVLSSMRDSIIVDIQDKMTRWNYYGRNLGEEELISEIQRICDKNPSPYAVRGTVSNLTIGALCKTLIILQEAGVRKVNLLGKADGFVLDKELALRRKTYPRAEYLSLKYVDNSIRWFYQGKCIPLDELRVEFKKTDGRSDLLFLISIGGNEQLPLKHLIDLFDVLHDAGVRKINLWDCFEGELSRK